MIYILLWLQASTAAGDVRHFFTHSHLTCATLLESIERDSDDYGLTEVPEPLALRLIKGDSHDLFDLSRTLWNQIADRDRLRALVARFEDGTADAADERTLHDDRARLKNLRFALTLFDREHGEGEALNDLAKAMGEVRDGQKTGNALWFKRGLRELEEALTRERWDELGAELDAFRVAKPADFYAYQVQEVERLRDLNAHPHLTGEQFHEMRKIVARFGALYGLLRARAPNARIETAYRYLSTLNGRMGARHDEFVLATARNELDYTRDEVLVPTDIRAAIAQLRP